MCKNIVICVKCGTEFSGVKFEYVNVHGCIILKEILRRYDGRALIELISLRTGQPVLFEIW